LTVLILFLLAFFLNQNRKRNQNQNILAKVQKLKAGKELYYKDENISIEKGWLLDEKNLLVTKEDYSVHIVELSLE